MINIVLLVLVISCVKTPDKIQTFESSGDYYIINEGSWGHDNSSISRFSLDGSVSNNYFDNVNNKPFGDMAQDIIKYNSNYILLVAGSGFLIEVNSNFEEIRRFNFNDFGFLKNFKLLPNNTLVISDLDKSELIIFDLINFNITTKISTGPGPEDIEYFDNTIFVANSAKGELADSLPESRTIGVYNANTFQKISSIPSKPNSVNLLVDSSNNRLYLAYPNFRWRKDSVGGIVEYDVNSFEVLREWKVNCYSDIILKNNNIYFLNSDGLNQLDLRYLNQIELVVKNQTDNIWYEFDFIDDNLFIFDVKKHTTNGDVLVYDKFFKFISRTEVGLNPRKIVKIKE